MAKEPIYEVLEKRIKELEKEAAEHKQVEEALRESEKKYRDLVENISDVFANENGMMTYISPAIASVLGYSPSEIIGKSFTEFIYQEDLPRMKKRFKEILSGKIQPSEYRLLNKSGEIRWISASIRPVFRENQVIGIQGVLTDITEYKQAKEALREKTHDLGKRVKELNCLYSISRLLEKTNISLEETLQETVDLIPPSWQYPEITCARVILQDQTFTTDNFNETVWKQACDIMVHGERIGALEVIYLEERPGSDEGPFLKEERSLINAIVERLGKVIERKQAEEALQKAHNELERRVQERTAELAQANEELQAEITERKRSNEMLRRSEESLAEAQSMAHLGSWDWDIVTNELQWSDEIYRILGLTPQELEASYEVLLNYVYPGDRKTVKKNLYEALHKNKPYDIHYRILLPNGTERIVHEHAKIIVNDTGKHIRMIGTVHDITEEKRVEEALKKSEDELRHLSYQLLKAHEEERKRIALELHDSLGQSLSAIKYMVEKVFHEISNKKTVNGFQLLEPIVPVVQEAVEEARRIQKNLRPPLLDDLGILPTITWFCREFETIYPEIRIQQEINVHEDDVPDYLKIIIFRILQEALNNIAKHSQTKLVHLLFKGSDGKIDLTIKDDGAGFDPNQVSSGEIFKRGFGLASMKERATISGGSLSIESQKGEGTTVRASWLIH